MIVVRFTNGSPANGLTCLAFKRSPLGAGLFFDFVHQVTVQGDTAVFAPISQPGEFAFRVDSPAGTLWRSGPLVMSTPATDTYWIVDPIVRTFTLADLASSLPATPFTRSGVTINSISLQIGSGSITASGPGSYASAFGAIPIAYSYVFTLDPVTDPADWRFPNGIPPTIDVRTVSLTVTGAAGGFLGWLVNPLVAVLVSVFHQSIRASIEGTVQAAVNAAVASALAAQGAPTGTIATAETVTIQPSEVTVVAFAGISLEALCASGPTGGSTTVRPPEQLEHLRIIRDHLTRSPQGMAYVQLFEQFSPELVRILLEHEDVLHLADEIAARALELFPRDAPGEGRVSRELADLVVRAMERTQRVASNELALTIEALKEDVHTFVDRPAGEVLADSFRLLS